MDVRGWVTVADDEVDWEIVTVRVVWAAVLHHPSRIAMSLRHSIQNVLRSLGEIIQYYLKLPFHNTNDLVQLIA